jgi:hypothetical protein
MFVRSDRMPLTSQDALDSPTVRDDPTGGVVRPILGR